MYISKHFYLKQSIPPPATQTLRHFSPPDPATKRHLQSWMTRVLAMQTFSHKPITNTPQHTTQTTRSRTPVIPLHKIPSWLLDMHLKMPRPAATSSPHTDLQLFLKLVSYGEKKQLLFCRVVSTATLINLHRSPRNMNK